MESLTLQKYFRVERNAFLDEHFHCRGNFLYLTEKGAYEYTVNGQTFQAGELDCVFYKKGSYYDRKVLRPAVLHLFELAEELPVSDAPISFLNRQRIYSNIALLNAIHGTAPENLPYIAHLLNDILYIHQQEKNSAYRAYDQRITQALELIRSSFDKEIAVTELARAVHLSYPQFNRLFVKQLGISPIRYINQLRLDKAKELLYTTDLPIQAVATECGFKDIYYFSNFFRAATGCSPTQYRKKPGSAQC